MRVTEHRLMQQSADGVAKAREQAAKAAQQTQSGVRVERPSDDPTAWAEGMRTNARHTMSQGRGSSALRAHDNLVASDEAMGGVGDALSRLKELSTQMANGTMSADERSAAVSEVAGLKATALRAANSRSADGEYLFGGNKGDVEPFTAAGAYVGDTGTRTVEIGESGVAVSSANGTVFTAASGTDVFALFDTVSAALSSNNQAAVSTALTSINSGINQIARARTETGGKMSTFEVAEDARAQFEVHLTEIYTKAVAADPVQAATKFVEAQSTLTTAQQVAQQIVAMLQTR